MKIITLIVLILGMIPLASGQATQTPFKHKQRLRLLTYNVHGLPGILAPDKGRAAMIGKMLGQRMKDGTAPDVVAIQESFTKKRSKQIIENSGYKHVYFGAKHSLFHMSSGLILLSKHPIVKSDLMTYKECYSHDCFARKGAQFIRIQIKGVPVPLDIYNTHTNSNLDADFWSDPERPKKTRIDQMNQFMTFQTKHTPSEVPVFLIGDFNMRPHEEAFGIVQDRGGFTDSAKVCSESKECEVVAGEPAKHFKSSVDHQFFRNGASPIYRITPVRFELNFKERPNGRELSDHSGLELDYDLEWD